VRLIVAALLLVAAVLGVQVDHGGGDFVPLRPANPCAQRPDTPVPARLEPLAERVVLVGLEEAGCRLHVSRERLLLSLAEPATLDPRAPAAITAGLLAATERVDLPPVSALLGQVLDESGLPGFAQDAIERLPDGVVDDLLPTDGLLHRAIEGLDVSAILDNLNDPKTLEKSLRDAILAAAEDEIRAQLTARLPGPLQDLLG
jgi:hypothetical protein